MNTKDSFLFTELDIAIEAAEYQSERDNCTIAVYKYIGYKIDSFMVSRYFIHKESSIKPLYVAGEKDDLDI